MPHFHVVGRDHPDTPERRLAAREAHLGLAESLKAEGKLLYAGALLNDEGGMAGSVLLFNVESREALDTLLKDEPYIQQDVFAEVEITEYRPAPIFAAQ